MIFFDRNGTGSGSFGRRGSILVLVAVLVVAAGLAAGAFFAGRWSADPQSGSLTGAVFKTFGDVFRPGGRRPVLEIDLGEIPAVAAKKGGSVAQNLSGAAPKGEKSGVKPKRAPSSSVGETEPASEATASGPGSAAVTSVCAFSSSSTPHHKVLLNEIAWMGTGMSASDEWIELRNNSGGKIPLRGWELVNEDETVKITFSEKDVLENNFFLLERTDDGAAPDVSADRIYSGALSNAGEWLKLFDERCGLADELNASAGWPAGDNKTKQTLERDVRDFGWHASVAAGGTPKRQNDDSIPSPSTPTAPSGTTTSSPPQTSSTPAVVRVVITEVMAGSDASASYEFVELYNPNDQIVNLFGWELRKRSSSGSESNLVDDGKFIGAIPARGYFLIGNPAYNGQPAADIIYSVTSADIAYTNNAILLYNGDHASASLVDQTSWTEIPKNKSWERASPESTTFSVQPNPTPQNSGN